MGVLDSLREDVYSTESLKTYELIRSTEPLLKPYPTFSSFLIKMQTPGRQSGEFHDQILKHFIQLIQANRYHKVLQAWIIFLLIPKLKTLQRKYTAIDDSDLCWETLRAINRFSVWEDRRFIASGLTKNIENALLKMCQKEQGKMSMPLASMENMAAREEPSEMQSTMSQTISPIVGRLTNLMNELGVSKEVQFVFLRLQEGYSLHQIAKMLGKKYDAMQKQLLREKQRLAKKHEKKSKKN